MLVHMRIHRLRRIIVATTLMVVMWFTFGSDFSLSDVDYAGILPLFSSSQSFKSVSASLLDTFDIIKVNESNWKLAKRFKHRNLHVVPNDYIALRKRLHHHDPRISLGAMISYLKGSESLEFPFSWQDWVDLAPLNPYVGLGPDQKPSCIEFLNVGLDFKPSEHHTTAENRFSEYYCLDDDMFLDSENGQFHSSQLLPGFNFQNWMPQKKTFQEKLIFAKSYVLSGLEPPSNILMLTDDDGLIKVKTKRGGSMSQSGVLERYLNSLNVIDDAGTVEIDPILEFEDFANNTDHINFGENLVEVDLATEEFVLDTSAYKDAEAIVFSESVDPRLAPKYFHEVNINFPANYRGHKLKEDGGHYDYRFFTGFLSEIPNTLHKQHSPEFPVEQYAYPENTKDKKTKYDSGDRRRRTILSNMVHTLLNFGYKSKHQIILAHGSLLGWYFNGLSFPWDSDADVQMPINQLMSFCHQFNQSMIFQNPRYGMGKYFLDCTSFLTHRTKANGNNNIDARFVDIDSGMFIDITGLAVSSETLKNADWSKLNRWFSNDVYQKYPKLNKQRGKNKTEDAVEIYNYHLENEIVNCRNRHFYSAKNLKNMRLTHFENAPVWIPKDFGFLQGILTAEYNKKGIEVSNYNDYVFIKELKMWVPAMSIYMACKANELEKNPKVKLNTILDQRPIARMKNKKYNSSLNGNHVLKCLNKDESGVLNKLINLANEDLNKDIEMDESQLNNELMQANIKLPPHVKVKYANVVQELYSIKEAVKNHQYDMEQNSRGWQWSDATIEGTEFDPKISLPPSRAPMLDYLIEVDRLNENL